MMHNKPNYSTIEKRRSFVVFFISMIILACMCSANVHAANIQIFRTNEFEISYPTSWQKLEVRNPTMAVLISNGTSTLDINATNFSGNKNEFMSDMRKNGKEQIQLQMRKRFPDASVVELRETFLGSFPAYTYKTKYSIKNYDNDISIANIQIFCIKDRRIFLVTFESFDNDYAANHSQFLAIIGSFNFR
ncbi:MAG: hypothetical protein HZB62_10160 [Nitrospirae bacterium]|nr:hypothetical protein [Nitrospirota bacterium]